MAGFHISLFSGIGATDIAAEAAGFKTIATAEVDPFCRSVLEARFPEAWHFKDVRQVRSDSALSIQRPLLVSGGFPCQDIASAGTGLGLSGSRSGLWSEFARVVREFRPEYVLIENSPLLRKRGLDVILSDLVALGYDVQWDCLPAAMVGAPHLRDRIYIWAKLVAQSLGDTRIYYSRDLPRSGTVQRAWHLPRTPTCTVTQARRMAEQDGRKLLPTPTKSDGSGGPGTTPKRTGGKNLRTVAAEMTGSGRLNPAYLEWMMGLPVGWTDPRRDNEIIRPHKGWPNPSVSPFPISLVVTKPENRAKRVRALGNALVPQVASIALNNLLNWK